MSSLWRYCRGRAGTTARAGSAGAAHRAPTGASRGGSATARAKCTRRRRRTRRARRRRGDPRSRRRRRARPRSARRARDRGRGRRPIDGTNARNASARRSGGTPGPASSTSIGDLRAAALDAHRDRAAAVDARVVDQVRDRAADQRRIDGGVHVADLPRSPRRDAGGGRDVGRRARRDRSSAGRGCRTRGGTTRAGGRRDRRRSSPRARARRAPWRSWVSRAVSISTRMWPSGVRSSCETAASSWR